MLKETPQLTFGMQEDNQMRQKKTMLDTINAVIDFTAIIAALETLYDREHGRPAIPPLMVFKILLLEQWYGLSDVEVVDAIHDVRSFERFLGQEIRHYHVDDTTLVKFRKRLRAAKMHEHVFGLMNEQLERRNLLVKKGTIIDSTLVAAATRAGSRRKDGTLVDADVETVLYKNNEVREGMKVHIALDTESELITAVALTSVRVHDHNVFKEMIPEETNTVYADKAYDSEAHRDYLQKRGIRNGILKKAHYKHPLTKAQHERNKERGSIRSAVERKINDIKRWCHLDRLRYYTKERNWVHVLCAAIAANLKRSIKLLQLQGSGVC